MIKKKKKQGWASITLTSQMFPKPISWSV